MKLTAAVKFTPRNDLGQFIKQRITPGVVASVKAACSLVVDRAKQLVPVDTGELRNSIGYQVDVREMRITGVVFANADHAGYVEFGTGRAGAASKNPGPYPYNPNWPGMRAQPYLRLALDETQGIIIVLFKSQINLQRTPYLTGGPF